MKGPSSINMYVLSIPNKDSWGGGKWGADKGKKLLPAMPDKNSNLSTKGHFCA